MNNAHNPSLTGNVLKAVGALMMVPLALSPVLGYLCRKADKKRFGQLPSEARIFQMGESAVLELNKENAKKEREERKIQLYKEAPAELQVSGGQFARVVDYLVSKGATFPGN